jgi:hypothetical protein
MLAMAGTLLGARQRRYKRGRQTMGAACCCRSRQATEQNVNMPPNQATNEGLPCRASSHAFETRRHREPICQPHYADVIERPTHVGQQPKYKDKAFELIKECAGGSPIILLGVGISLAKGGVYAVHTAYPIHVNTLQRRIRVGTVVAT